VDYAALSNNIVFVLTGDAREAAERDERIAHGQRAGGASDTWLRK
jgi:hypothetical protein